MISLPDTDSEDELPPGWEERATDDGTVCYVNQQGKTSQWTHPRTGRSKRITGELPLGWEKYYDEQGKRFMFLNKETQQRTNVDPRLAFAVEEPTQNVAQVRQRFDSCSTALQILHGKDLHGRTALITGANCGIGFETARSLAHHGCEIIFACRNRSSTEAAIERIAQERPAARARCRFAALDLCSLRSVQRFVEEIKQSFSHIDYLILNAGVFALPYTKTEDGLETTFQVSHLSHFHLTLQLETLFDYKTRIIVLSSESHRPRMTHCACHQRPNKSICERISCSTAPNHTELDVHTGWYLRLFCICCVRCCAHVQHFWLRGAYMTICKCSKWRTRLLLHVRPGEKTI